MDGEMDGLRSPGVQRVIELEERGEVEVRKVDCEEVRVIPVGRCGRSVDTGMLVGIELEGSMELTVLRVRAAEGQKWDKFAGADRDVACVPFIAT